MSGDSVIRLSRSIAKQSTMGNHGRKLWKEIAECSYMPPPLSLIFLPSAIYSHVTFYFNLLTKLDEIGLSARRHIYMAERAADAIRLQYTISTNPSPPLSKNWTKRWLDRQPVLFKGRQKPLAAERKNAENSIMTREVALSNIPKIMRLFSDSTRRSDSLQDMFS